jgi:ribosomal protein L37E
MVFKRKYTDDQFIQAVKESLYMTDALRKLGITTGGAKFAKDLLKKLNIDTSHWIDPNILKGKNLRPNLPEIPLEKILVENSKYVSSSDLKKKLFKYDILKEQCYECGLGNTWNNKKIVLQIDHINGAHNDNRIENLRILCPNCHSQTDTFAGKLNTAELPKCKLCDSRVKDKRSKMCKSCNLQRDFRKNEWPLDQELIRLCNLYTFKKVGLLVNKNESSVIKRVKQKNLRPLITRQIRGK